MWIYFQQPTRITEAAHTLCSVYPERSSDTCSALLLQYLSSIPTSWTLPRRELNSPGFTPLVRVGELLLSTQTQTHTVGFASPSFTHWSVCFYLNGVLPLFCWCDTSDTHTRARGLGQGKLVMRGKEKEKCISCRITPATNLSH